MKAIAGLSGRIRFGAVGRNTVLGGVGLGLRAAIQAAYLIVLSRCLGASGYGLFGGSVAAVMLLAPLAGWGATFLVTRHVATDRGASRSWWATALVQIAATGMLLGLVFVLAAAAGARERLDLVSLALLALSELLALPMAQAGTALCFSIDRGMPAAIAICTVPIARLGAALVVAASGLGTSPAIFATSHFVGSLAGLAATIVLVARIDGWPDWAGRVGLRRSLHAGTSYAVAGVFNVGYLELDKVVMLETLGAAVVGPYTAAFRVMMVFVLPVSALVNAALPVLFAEHRRGGHSRTLRLMLAVAAAYATAATVLALIAAPLAPSLFGPEFHEVTRYMVLLAPWPFLYAMHQCGVAALTAFDRQRLRVAIEGGGFVLVAVMNIVLLPRMGASASVLALVVAEALMAIACWLARSRPSG